DVENFRMLLGTAFFVALQDDVNALRRTILFADFARYATQSLLRILAVVNEEREVAGILFLREPFLGVLDCDEPRFFCVAADEVARGLDEALGDAFADHRSTSP